MKVYSYIYQLSDETGVRYIGQTISGLVKRKNDHVSEALRGRMTHKDKWIRLAISRGIDIEILEVESGLWTQEERDEREIHWIAEYKKRGAHLTNSTLGGNGHIPDEKERQYISQKTKEAMARPEVRAKMKKLVPIGCATCGAVFEPRKSRDKTCSRECGQKLATALRTGVSRVDKKVTCLSCGEVFIRSKPKQLTCNTKCAGAYRGDKTKTPYPDGTCVRCGGTFTRTRKNRSRTTCSERCRYDTVADKRKNNG